jgi:outer membrane protein assembly factor BamB
MFHHDLKHTGYSTSTAPTNKTIWAYTTGNSLYSSPAVVDSVVFVGSQDNNVYAFAASSGAYVWTYVAVDGVWSSPAVANSIMCVGSVDGKIYAFGFSPSGGALPQIEMYAVIAIAVIVMVAIAAAVYLAVRRRKPEP